MLLSRTDAGIVRSITLGAAFLLSGPATALSIVPNYDASVTSQAAAGQIEAAFNTVAADFDAAFSNAATVNVTVSWNKVGGTALPASAVGASQSNLYGYYTYSQIKSLLTTAAAGNPADQTLALALSHLPAAAPVGQSNYVVTAAEAQALGIAPAKSSMTDGYIGFAGTTAGFGFNPASVTASQYDFQAVAAHELSEVMGRISGVASGAWRTPFDLFRYTAPGVLSYSYSAKTYFSVDGGVTRLQTFNATGGGDRSDWATSGTTTDAFDAYISRGQRKGVSAVDLAALDVLGWSGANAGNTGGSLSGTAFALSTNVPEPASWAMMLIGLALVGGVLRRRPAVRVTG